MPDYENQFDPVHVSLRGSLLDIDMKTCRRVWQINNGLRTVFFGKGRQNLLAENLDHTDWQINVCKGAAEFQEFHCSLHPADNRTGEYVEIQLIFLYREADILVRYEIDCYPEASGFRTQLAFKSTIPIPACGPAPEKDQMSSFIRGYSESLVIAPEKFKRLAFGYACDSQHRYDFDTPILTETRCDAKEVRTTEVYEAHNGLVLTDCCGRSVTLIKESHKCTNCTGLYTGGFVLHSHDVRVTGLGFSQRDPYWINDETFHTAWANWILYSENGEKGMQNVLKQFDRMRYPFREKRDMLIAANLWGSRGSGEISRCAAEEQNLIKELQSCSELGIDLLQVDDGWEFDPGDSDFSTCAWVPSKIRFPHGWKLLRETAEKLKVKLGIWFPASTDTDKIIQNIREADFKRVKLDFTNLSRRNDLDELLEKVDVIAKISPEIGINWDITEISPRMGFFFGRESGNIFLQNNENSIPGGCQMSFIGYDPELTLRQVWMLGKYLNLNQVQITVQRVLDSPNGKGYPQDYAFAVAMMGIPLFFTETCRFSPAEREQLKALIAVYKQYRSEILHGFTHPVGGEPFGCSWTGFQCKTSKTEGFLLIFREKDAQNDTGRFQIDTVSSKLRLTALYNGKDMILEPDPDGSCTITGINCSSFAFYRYTN